MNKNQNAGHLRSAEKEREQFTRWAMKILSIAQTGLTYSENPFDRERYRELKEIGSQMLAWQIECSVDDIHRMMETETGYPTPKIDTRAAVFQDDRILLVREMNGKWSLPRGWCETDLSIGENAVKEMHEESGYLGEPVRILAAQDWRKHNPCNLPFGVLKVFIECRIAGKDHSDGLETTEARFFGEDEIPENLSLEKNTREQIAQCIRAHKCGENWQTLFD